MTATILPLYYSLVDGGSLEQALALLDEKVTFTMLLPTGARRGEGRGAMADYLTGRGVANRRHVLLRTARDQDVEFVYGKVTEGEVTTGRFLAGARLSADGLIASYQVTFETEHQLVED